MNDTNIGATVNEEQVATNTQDSNVEAAAQPSTESTATESSSSIKSAVPAKKRSLSEIIAEADKAVVPPEAKAPEAKVADVKEQPQTQPPAADVDPLAGQPLPAIKVPVSVPLPLREKFGTLPREFQEFLAKREAEVQNVFKTTAAARKFEQDVRSVYAPYDTLFKQHGVNPLEHTKELLQLNYALHAGDAHQKATILGNLILQHKPDPQTLAQIFSGQGHRVAPPPVAPDKTVDQLVEERLTAQQEEQILSVGQKALQAFQNDPANEFFPYVQEIMGQLIESGAVTGDPATDLWKNAYDAACSIHPDVKAVLAQRAAQPQQQMAAPAAQVPAAQAPVAKKPVIGLKPSVSAQHAPLQKRTKGLNEAIAAAFEQSQNG